MSARWPGRAVAAISVFLLGAFAIACGSTGPEAGNQTQRELAVAGERYRAYLSQSAKALVEATQAMSAEVEAGERTRAQSRYARARVRYSQLELEAQSLDALDARINASATEVPSSAAGGFHRIERALWAERGSLEPLVPVAKQLIRDCKELQSRLETARLDPADTLTGSQRLLRELLRKKMKGWEEWHADLDLVDVAANVEALENAFRSIRPLVPMRKAAAIEERLADLYEMLGVWGDLARESDQPRQRSPGVSFVVFSQLPAEEKQKISRVMAGLIGLYESLPRTASARGRNLDTHSMGI